MTRDRQWMTNKHTGKQEISNLEGVAIIQLEVKVTAEPQILLHCLAQWVQDALENEKGQRSVTCQPLQHERRQGMFPPTSCSRW